MSVPQWKSITEEEALSLSRSTRGLWDSKYDAVLVAALQAPVLYPFGGTRKEENSARMGFKNRAEKLGLKASANITKDGSALIVRATKKAQP